MPLLVDMKIYGYIMRFLYGRDYHTCNVRFWLKDVPLLYGAWHPYKYTLTLIWRKFFPIISQLLSSVPHMTEDVPANRGVQYMEKVMGGCVLPWPKVKDILTEMLKALEKMRRPLSVSNAATLHKIRGLVRLLSRSAPAIFIIGNTLRKLNWEVL